MRDKKIYFNLQICRGIAAIMVLLDHATQIIKKNALADFLITGRSGVDFFFILSGFIIYYINLKYIGNAAKLTTYLTKRLVRIYPIYWLITILVLLLHILMVKVSGKHLIGWNTLSVPAIIRSFLLYPANTAAGAWPVILVAWTLSFEMIFYIIFGLGILTNKNTLLFIIIIWLAGIGLNTAGVINIANSPLLATVLDLRNVEFVFGCLIAELTLKNKIIDHKNGAVALLFTGLFLLLASCANDAFHLKLFPQIDILTYGISYCIIIYASISLETQTKTHSLLKKALVYLGDASYSIYLTHYIGIIMLKLTLHRFIHNEYVAYLFIVTVLIGFGCGCYQFIEKPLLNAVNKFFSKKQHSVAAHTS